MSTRWPNELPPPGELDFLPTRRVVWGPGSIGRLEELLDAVAATRVLVLTSRSLAQEGELVARVRRHCGSRYAAQFDQVPAHVPRPAVDAAVAAALAVRANALVAFGGGSVIDAAKAVSARLADEHGRAPAIVAVPTTLSGAEFADHYGVTDLHGDDAMAAKRTYTRQDVTPAAVVLDARLTAATPRWLWAGSAVKALDHAVEGLLCSPPRPVLDELAAAGIRRFVSVLPRSLDPEAVDARQACQIAAWYCYFAPASLTLGLSHRIGHVLGGTYGVPHAFTSGLTLPAVVHVTGRTVPPRLALLADSLGADGPVLEPGLARDPSPDALLSRLIVGVGLPSRLREVGIIQQADLEVIARQVAGRYPSALGQLAGTGVTLHQLLDGIW